MTDFESALDTDEVIYCPHCNAVVSFPPDEELPAGRRIGGFEISELLGRGGMGNVYLARQLSMDRLVALKILPATLTVDKSSVEQFMNEVRMTGRMEHPNIVTAIDAGEDDDLYFFAMAFVKGEDLEKRIDRIGFIPEKTALKYILQISDALEYALKKHNLIHKDIKPGNIMVNENGDAFLLDMGIAQKIGEGKKKLHIEGSPFYMSPEQARNETLSWSSDLYSLGATLYHMIVGQPPYDDPDVMNIVRMQSEAPFPPPVSRNRDVEISPDCVRLLQKMMEKRTVDRFDSWDEFKKTVKDLIKSKKGSPKGGTSTNTTALLKKIPSRKQPSFNPATSTRKRVIIVKEDKNALLPLINTIVIFAVIVVGVFFGMRYFMESQARKGLSSATSYIERPSYDAAEALRLVETVRHQSGNLFISSSSRTDIRNTCDALRIKVDEKIRLRQTFDSNYKTAENVYAEALTYLKKNELSSAKIACDNAIVILEKLEAPSSSDKIKLDSLMEGVKNIRTKISEAISRKR